MRLVRYTYPSYRSLATLPAGLARSPWSGLESEIDRLFESALGDFTTVPSTRFPVDLYEDKNNTYVRAELPGFNRDDINVEVVDGYLNLTAARKAPTVPATDSAQAEGQAAPALSLSRSIGIPEDVQADKVSAAYENGVLTVTLPKREEAKPKKVTVAVK